MRGKALICALALATAAGPALAEPTHCEKHARAQRHRGTAIGAGAGALAGGLIGGGVGGVLLGGAGGAAIGSNVSRQKCYGDNNSRYHHQYRGYHNDYRNGPPPNQEPD